MFKSFRGRVIVVVAALAVAGYSLWQRGVKQGLDLQGGMHLVLEIDDPEGLMTDERRADAIDRAERILRTRIDQFGVEEPLIQKIGRDRLIVELAGIDDETRAKEIINQQAFLEWKLVLATTEVHDDLERLDRAVVAALGEEGLREMGRAVEASPDPTGSIGDLLFGRADSDSADSAAAESSVSDSAAASPAEETEAAEDSAGLNFRPFTGLLNQGGTGNYLVDAQDVETAAEFMTLEEFQRALPRNVSLQWGWEDSIGIGGRFYRELYVLEDEAFLTGDQLEDASATRDPQTNLAQVLFELNRRGGRDFQRLTSAHIGDPIAIVLDGEVVSAPVVRDRIGANGSIDLGTADMSEAVDLALVLRAGALPAPLQIMEERTVGPSLGQDSIDKGRVAGIVGVIAVLTIMILYYRVAGMLAIVALGAYLVLVMGGLSAVDATLTLPGIAGLILSIGMAVDANVLIFERIREELEGGRAVRAAVEEGFGNAVSAIVDANITTLITGVILFQFGTGAVRGFAVTLCIGIVASFFSALYVTRTLFLLYLSGKRAPQRVSI